MIITWGMGHCKGFKPWKPQTGGRAGNGISGYHEGSRTDSRGHTGAPAGNLYVPGGPPGDGRGGPRGPNHCAGEWAALSSYRNRRSVTRTEKGAAGRSNGVHGGSIGGSIGRGPRQSTGAFRGWGDNPLGGSTGVHPGPRPLTRSVDPQALQARWPTSPGPPGAANRPSGRSNSRL